MQRVRHVEDDTVRYLGEVVQIRRGWPGGIISDSGVEEQRTREAFKRSMAEMRLGLAGRGVELSSPSALALADDAAREMTAASQDVRSRSAARADELTAEGRRARAVGANAVMRGTLGAASSVLTAAPDLWPGLADRKLRA